MKYFLLFIKRRTYKGTSVVLFLFIVDLAVFSQQNQTLYFMHLPQSTQMNPALIPDCRGYFDLPVVGSTNLLFQNNSLKFSDIIFPGTGVNADSLITILHPDYNIDDFLAKLNPSNHFSLETHTNLFSVGFHAGNSMIHFSIYENVEGSVVFPSDLATLIFKGNEAFLGSEINLTPFSVDLTWYRSYALGFSQELFPGFRLGLRGRVLTGIANVSLKNTELSIGIDETDFSHTLNADMSLNVSGPVTFIEDSTGNIEDVQMNDFNQAGDVVSYLLSFKNPGFAGDFGVEYNLLDKLSLSASVVDLGFIYWKRDVSNLVSRGEFTFKGIDVSPEFNVNDTNSIEDVANNLVDSLKQIFYPAEKNIPYFTSLHPKIYVGGTWAFAEQFSLGLLSRTEIAEKELIQSLTFSANTRLGRFLYTTLSYTLANHAYDNIGAGLALRGGPFQFYVMTDYGLGAMFPDETKALNAWFGLNLTFGCRRPGMTDPPMIL